MSKFKFKIMSQSLSPQDDIDALHDKFKVQYPHSNASKGSKTRDLPPVSGSIIWARQIDQQLTMYLKRVEDVLGKTWERHVEGQKLKADGDSFRQKLNTQQLFEDWQAKVRHDTLLCLFAFLPHKLSPFSFIISLFTYLLH